MPAPEAINRQKSRWTSREGRGRPGERIGARSTRSARHRQRLTPHKRHQHPHSTPQTPRQLASLIKLSRQPAESTALPSSRTSFSSTLDPPRLTARRYRTGRPGSIPDSPRPGAQSPVMAPGSPVIRRMAAPTASTSPARPPPTPRRSPRPQPGTTRYSSPRRCSPPPDMRGHKQSALSQGKEHHHPYSSPQR